jgi:DNA-directed RNA polymerase subunit omega
MFKIPEDFGSKYRFVMLAALRAEQLQAGAVPRIDTVSQKATVMAQEEVAAGAVESWDPSQPQPVEAAVESEG